MTIENDILAIHVMDMSGPIYENQRRALMVASEIEVTTHQRAQIDYLTPYLIVKAEITGSEMPINSETQSLKRVIDIYQAISFLAMAEQPPESLVNQQ